MRKRELARIQLLDEARHVRLAWARRPDWGLPTRKQVEAGLTDQDFAVRAAWVKRTDWGRLR